MEPRPSRLQLPHPPSAVLTPSIGGFGLKIETQDDNVPACRFYAAKGCELRGIHHGMYVEYPDEVQLLWYLNL